MTSNAKYLNFNYCANVNCKKLVKKNKVEKKVRKIPIIG